MEEENRTCPVCLDLIVTGKGERPRHRVYGGAACCRGCRAFFRRTFQTSKRPNFACHLGGNCRAESSTRIRRCHKCRLDGCLKAGMKPHLVMSSKVKRENNNVANENCWDQATESGIAEDKTEGRLEGALEHGQDQLQQSQQQQQLDTELMNSNQTLDDIIQLIKSSPASEGTGKTGMSVYANDNVSKVRMVRQSLLEVLDENLITFTKHARETLGAILVSLEDIDMVMAQFKRIFINLIFSSYLTSQSCQEQLSWLGMSGVRLDNLIFLDSAQHFAMTKLNLFNGDKTMIDLYLAYAGHLRQLGVVPCSKYACSELMMIYPGKLNLNRRQKVIATFEDTASKVNIPLCDAYDMGQTLEAMSVLLDQDGLARHLLCHADQKGPQIDKFISMRYSATEENWLVGTRDKMLKAMMSVPHGPILNQELENAYKYGKVMIMMDVMRVGDRMIAKRLWNSYLSVEQFRDLPHNEQSILVRSSQKLLGTLIAAKIDGRAVNGENLILSPQELASSRKLQQLSTMTVDLNAIFGKMPPEWYTCRTRVQDALSGPDGQMRFFALISLILFSSACLPPARVTSRPTRRFQSLKKWLDICLNRRFGNDYVDVLYPAFRDVRTMCNMLPSYEDLVKSPSATEFGV